MCSCSMAESAATRFLARVICVLTVAVLSSARDLVLEVDYPEDNNFNTVTLRCREDGRLTELVQNAVFSIDEDDLSRSDLVSVVGSETNSERTTFTFAEAREGSFSCSDGDDTSDPILLAGKDGGVCVCVCVVL